MSSYWRLTVAAMATMVACAAALFSAAPASAIIGGAPAGWDSNPYFGKVKTPAFGVDESCGGAIIAPTWVLTAAHCVAGQPVSGVSVQFVNGSIGGALSVIIDPPFDGDLTDGHDLALIEVPQWSTAGITPVQVGSPWNQSVFAAGTPVMLMGTGRTAENATLDGVFRVAETTVRSDDEMDDIYNRVWSFDHWIEHLMIGAGGSLRTTCYGDSGSPMVATLNNHPVVIGITSFTWSVPLGITPGCGEAGGSMEMTGPQLAWIAQWVPTVKTAWGPCAQPSGAAGVPNAFYGPYDQGDFDGNNRWEIFCGPVPRPPAPPAPPPAPRPGPGGCPGGGAIKCK
jgi:hypothetical protein